MMKFLSPSQKSPATPKTRLPGSFIDAVARCVWERQNLTKRWPKFSPHSAAHSLYKKQDYGYGWAGTLFAKLNPSFSDKTLKEAFDVKYAAVKAKS